MDRQYKKFGPDMSAISQLESFVYSPSYNLRAEIREPHLPPTAMVLFKVWKPIDYSVIEFVTALIGPIPWGHSGPLCHALSLSSLSMSWTSMRWRRATVLLATSGEWA